MGRPKGTNNKMRTPEEKEKIVKEYLEGESPARLNRKYDLPNKLIYQWIKKYEDNGFDGLKSNTGKYSTGGKGLHFKKPKNKID